MAPRERFELPWQGLPVVRSEISFFRDHRLTGLDYLGVGYGKTPTSYKPFTDLPARGSGLWHARLPMRSRPIAPSPTAYGCFRYRCNR